MEILHIENLNFRYPKAEKDTLHNISLIIGQGDFTVICGATGCGKTTLLKLIKNELAPAGEKSGEILYNGKSIDSLSLRESACAIGFVGQNPDNQIVTDKVWHELSFGLENLGVPQNVIRRRVGEMASYFGIQDWFRKKTDELSGGQKQLLNLASVMVMQPKLLILDEPTSQLDPIAAADFIATLKKLNTEFGITVLLVENAIQHGIEPSLEKCMLYIGAMLTNEEFIIEIRDDGVGMSPERLAHMQKLLQTRSYDATNYVGITNTNARLKLQYGDAYGITIDSQENDGTVVAIHMPLPQANL